MNRLDKRFAAWARGESMVPTFRGYDFTPTHLWFLGRAIAVRAKSPITRKVVIWSRESWPDGGLLDSEMDEGRHFKGRNWKAVPSELFDEISNAVSTYTQARRQKRPERLSNLKKVGKACRWLIKLLENGHSVLEEDDERVALFCLSQRRGYVAFCTWVEDSAPKSAAFKNMEDAVLHKLTSNAKLYRLRV